MKQPLAAAAIASLIAIPAFAEGIGLKFDEMPVGTTLITETRDDDARQYAQEYLGKEGGFHVIQLSKITEGKKKPLAKRFYDANGRRVRTEKKGKFSSSNTPFSCEYVLGPCEQTYVYANPFKNGKRVTHEDRYDNTLEDGILTVSKRLRNGDYLNIPYELGRYNLRVSSEFTNRLGQVRGFKLIEIVEP